MSLNTVICGKEALSAFINGLLKKNYIQHEGLIFTRSLDETWTIWIAITNVGQDKFRIVFGMVDIRFEVIFYEASQAFASEHNKIIKIPSGIPSFIINLEDAAILNNNDKLSIDCNDGNNTIIGFIEHFLESRMDPIKCLDTLDRFSQGMSRYLSSRLVLLALIQDQDGIEETQVKFLNSAGKSKYMIDIHQKFVNIIRNRCVSGQSDRATA